jgi:hypothetical protein
MGAGLGPGGQVVVAALLLLSAVAAADVPAEFQGWRSLAARTYDSRTIFDYIDGAGEVYRSYRFRSLEARRLEREGRPALLVDLFDMGSPEDAFGVFTHDLDGEAQGIGQGSTYKAGLLSFWKDRWFVSIQAEEETPEARAAALALGRRIAASIPSEGRPPDLLGLLPREGLQAGRVRAFHDHLVLRHHLPLFRDNLLLLDAETAVVLAPYGEPPSGTRLLLVRYPGERRAEEARRAFAGAFLAGDEGRGVARTAEGSFAGARRGGAVLAVVLGAPSEREARRLLDGAAAATGAR